jgi:hypothetical protein
LKQAEVTKIIEVLNSLVEPEAEAKPEIKPDEPLEYITFMDGSTPKEPVSFFATKKFWVTAIIFGCLTSGVAYFLFFR